MVLNTLAQKGRIPWIMGTKRLIFCNDDLGRFFDDPMY